MISASVLLLLISTTPVKEWAPANTQSRWMLEGEGKLLQEAKALQSRPLTDRLLGISQGFLDTPYVHSPLGEGKDAPVDSDPTFRVDAVDCLTFVEETIALAVSKSDADVPATLERIRYADKPTYEDRNHLMEAQWLPKNVEKGFLRDVTERYGETDAVAAEKVLTAKTWTSKSSAELKLPKDKQVTGTFKFKLIPLEKVLERARKVPAGTLLLVVREDLPLKATRITHLGFLHHKKGRPMLRHAARNAYGRVIDEDLETFLTRNGKYEKWRVSGVALYEVREPPPIKTVAKSSE